jgi:hypothetical protein
MQIKFRVLTAKVLTLSMLVAAAASPGFSKTHKDMFDVPCSTLWLAVKDVLRNSGKYGIIGISNEEMTASYNIGGTLTAKRTNSVVLNTSGNSCELQLQTAFSGLANNDAGAFKKRLSESLEKVQQKAASTSNGNTEAARR